MSSQYLFTLESVGTIIGRGVVLFPGLVEAKVNERLKIGDPIALKKPDGSREVVRINGFERARLTGGKTEILIFFSGLTKEDVPAGTEVWSVDRESSSSVTPQSR